MFKKIKHKRAAEGVYSSSPMREPRQLGMHGGTGSKRKWNMKLRLMNNRLLRVCIYIYIKIEHSHVLY
jgi:hypothetical protein